MKRAQSLSILALAFAPAGSLTLALAAVTQDAAPDAPEAMRVFDELEQAVERVERALDEGALPQDVDAAALARRLAFAGARLDVLARDVRRPLAQERRVAWARAHTRATEADDQARPWIEAASQTRDAELREGAFAELRAALAGADERAAAAALTALAELGEAPFDKASFRGSVLPFTVGHEDWVRVKALYALWNTAPEDGDLALVLELASSDSLYVQDAITHLIALFAKGAIEGEAADVVLRLLATPDPRLAAAFLRGLWGARVSPEVAARMIDLAEGPDPKLRRAALWFGLATLRAKSGRVIDALLRALNDDDPELQHRALWGLGHGVPDEHLPRIAETLIELHATGSSARMTEECARWIERFGDATHAARLK